MAFWQAVCSTLYALDTAGPAEVDAGGAVATPKPPTLVYDDHGHRRLRPVWFAVSGPGISGFSRGEGQLYAAGIALLIVATVVTATAFETWLASSIMRSSYDSSSDYQPVIRAVVSLVVVWLVTILVGARTTG